MKTNAHNLLKVSNKSKKNEVIDVVLVSSSSTSEVWVFST